MPSNTKTSTAKSVAPFNARAQGINIASKGAQRPATQTTASALKVDTKAPIDVDQASTNQSDEENVCPAPKEPSEPLSPLLSALSGIPKAQERDLRAYEHDRQRTKRAGERALRRARKVASSGGTGKRAPSITGEDKDRDTKRKPRGKFEVEVDAGVDAVSKATRAIRAAALIEGLSRAVPGAGLGAIAIANERAMMSVGDWKGIQVNFEDLLVHSSQRKSKKTREEEFELVPALKGVIVLDDMPMSGAHDMEIDEPWEHIESEEGEGKKMKAGRRAELSYAAIVVGTAE